MTKSRGLRRPLTSEIKLAAVQMRGQGLTARQIGAKLGYTQQTIQRVWAEARAVAAEQALQGSTDRAPVEAARSDAGAVILPALPGVASNSNLVLSLMARGLSREKAVEQATLYRARKEQAAATARSVNRISSSKLGQSLHDANHGEAACKSTGEILTTNFGAPT